MVTTMSWRHNGKRDNEGTEKDALQLKEPHQWICVEGEG